MPDRPTGPASPTRPADPPRTKRPGVVDADRPSETMGVLPGVGEGAAAAHFVRDAVPGGRGEGEEEPDASAEGRDPRP